MEGNLLGKIKYLFNQYFSGQTRLYLSDVMFVMSPPPPLIYLPLYQSIALCRSHVLLGVHSTVNNFRFCGSYQYQYLNINISVSISNKMYINHIILDFCFYLGLTILVVMISLGFFFTCKFCCIKPCLRR